MDPEAAEGKLALVGYGGVDRLPDGLVAIQVQFRVGRIIGYEGHKPPAHQQFAIAELRGEGMWHSSHPQLECARPPVEEDGTSPACWFRCVELHSCVGIELANTVTGVVVRPDFFGVRLSGRGVAEVEPRTGQAVRYELHRERYLSPTEIAALLGLGKLA